MPRRQRVVVFVGVLALIALSWPPSWDTWLGYAIFLFASWPGKSMDPEPRKETR